ncbi:MAG TPA: c-type cytochrome [Gallionella sp.]|nr:c-type cytochrome [Gallionella sp.]
MKRHAAAISLLLALLAGCSEKQEPGAISGSPPDIAAGKALAQAKCAGCHGMDGRGAKDGIPNLAAQIESYLLKAIQTYDHGKRAGSSDDAMNVVRELNPDQLRDVLGYYASLPPLPNLANMSAQYSYYDRGEELSKPCAPCHGTGGNPTAAGMPRLAGQHPQYFIKTATRIYREGASSLPPMHEALTGLSQADLSNIAIYFALNKPQPAPLRAGNPYEGRQFANECIKCHGATGSGDESGTPSLAGQDVKYLSTMIKAYRDKVREHDAMHKTLGGMKDREIGKIAAFFAAEQPAQIAFTPPEPIAELAEKCDRCHSLANPNPETPAPRLNGQNRGYLIKAMTAYRDGHRGDSAMHKISAGLFFDATIEGIATHYSAQAAK